MVYLGGACCTVCFLLWNVGVRCYEKTPVDHVALQDNRQPQDSVSNGIKLFYSFSLI